MERIEHNTPKSVREFQERFSAGEFKEQDFHTQCNAGWYDWFCDDSSLAKKTERYGKMISRIEEGNGKIDIDHEGVFFMNCCPFDYPLYDSIRFINDDGNILLVECGNKALGGKLWQVVSLDESLQSDPRTKVAFAQFYADTGYVYPVVAAFDNVRDLVKWFNDGRSIVECVAEDGLPAWK